MKKKSFLIIVVFIVILIVLGGHVLADDEFEINMLSQEYTDWLKLSEEEKRNTMEPFPFDIEYKTKSNSVFALRSRMKASGKSNLLPASYDLREHIDVEVKDQLSTNSCWAFSSNSALETFLSLNGENWNFSERHIEYSTASNFKDGQNKGSIDRVIGSGGNSYISFAYFSRGDGPILENDMPFENNENEISINDLPSVTPIKHVEGMKFFPSIKKSYNNDNKLIYTDANGNEYSDNDLTEIRNEIKEHIMKYGGISAVINFTDAFYNTRTAAYNMNVANISTNHVVTIIGWDDSYSADNFGKKPSSNGAYIVLNSWGQNWGQNGVFYVSYEDILIERYLSGITMVSDLDYNNIYQHDMSMMSAYLPIKYAANVFTAQKDETLTEVVVALPSNQMCDIYINPSNDSLNIEELTPVASNISLDSGYNSIKLNNPIELQKGNKFAIVVKIIDYDGKSVGMESKASCPSVTSENGESFYSSNGISWTDVHSPGSDKNFIIKALTQREEEINIGDLTGKIYNDGTGNISFDVLVSNMKENKAVDLEVIYSHTNEDVTELFDIDTDIIEREDTSISFSPITSIRGGKYILNIKIDGFETITKEFIVLNEESTVLEILELPKKRNYSMGEELDLTGGYIIIITPDGVINEVDLEYADITIEEYDKSKVGEQEIVLLYDDMEIEYTITVHNNITSIKIKTFPDRINYLKGEELDLSGMVLVAVFEDETEEIIDLSDENLVVEGYNSNWLGEEEITLTYKGLSVEFPVYLHDKDIESQVYEIDEQYISEIKINTTILDFKENMSFYNSSYIIFEDNKEVTDEETIIKTGQVLVINDREYELVVTGDINGDGKIKASDLSSLKRTLIGVNELTGAYYKAADLNDDGKIKASDLSKLKVMLIGE